MAVIDEYLTLREKGPGEFAKDAANFALNGGPAGWAANKITNGIMDEDKNGEISDEERAKHPIAGGINDFTGKKRETAGEFAAAVGGRAAIAATAVAAPILAKYGINLAGDALNKLVSDLFGAFRKNEQKDNASIAPMKAMTLSDLQRDKQKYTQLNQQISKNEELKKLMPQEARIIQNVFTALGNPK